MSTRKRASLRSRRPVRVAIVAASLAVVGCFSMAFTFSATPAQAEVTAQAR